MIPGINIDALRAFEQNIMEPKTTKEKVSCAKKFLHDIVGVELSELYKEKKNLSININEKEKQLFMAIKHKPNANILDGCHFESPLDGLFE